MAVDIASAGWCMGMDPLMPVSSRASAMIFMACAGLIAAAVVPHTRRAARSTSEVSVIGMEPEAVVAPATPSPKSVWRAVWPTASSAAMPGSERSCPASAAATAKTTRNPAPSVHSGTVAQEAIP